MTRFKFPLFFLVATISASAWGQCLTPAVTPAGPVPPGSTASLEFEAVEGADGYQIEAFDAVIGGWFVLGTSPEPIFELPPISSASDQAVKVRVLAISSPNSSNAVCVGEATVQFEADEQLRSQFGRVVIPVAGSLPGAFDSQWRTMLSLTNSRTQGILSGEIVFHPAGYAVGDQLPSIRYFLEPGEVMQWPDIVAAMGGNGLGAIDIVPDEPENRGAFGAYTPVIQARVVNEAGDATFGTEVDPVFVRDLAPAQLRRFYGPNVSTAKYSAGLGTSIIIPADFGQTRLNIGLRYFDFHDLFWLLPLDPRNTAFVQLALRRDGEFVESVMREGAPGVMEQIPVDDIFTAQVLPGDVVVIRAISALVYWTITDNETNDPSFFFDVYAGQSNRILYE